MSKSTINFLSADMSPVDATKEDCINGMLFEFKTKEEDYMLRYFINWDIVSARIFHMKIGNNIFSIPSSFHVMIGDLYGEVDWMMVDEMINREVECVTFDSELESWSIDPPELIDVSEEKIYWPMTQNIIPCESDSRIILMSKKDQYHMTKNFLIDSFLVSV